MAFADDIKTHSKNFWTWLNQPERKEQVKNMTNHVLKSFTEHPHATGETYWEHLWFTIRLTSRLLYSGTVLFIHGLMPFTFTRTASQQIEIMYKIMISRIPANRRKEIEGDYNI